MSIVICEYNDLKSIADSIRNRTETTESLAIEEMPSCIGGINTDMDISDATATESDMLLGTTAYTGSGKITGTMPNNGAISSTMDGIDVKSITIPKGYTSGGTVSLDNTIDNEVNTQTDLIAQISTALEGKASGGVVLPTLTNEGTANDLLSGKQLIDSSGNIINGTMAIVTQATPNISVNASGLITATTTQSTGYVTAGTKSATKQLAFQPAKTITPTKSVQTAVSSGYYTGGAITVAAIPSTYIQPSGTLSVTANGTHDVTNYASVNVNVASGGTGSVDNEAKLLDGTLTTYENNNVTSLRSYAFYSCTKLTSVNFPACTSIGSNAFSGCASLTTINFPVCISIGSSAFYNCKKLTTISFPKCTRIGSNAFYLCGSLKSANFPACTSIGGSAFNACASLTTINFPVCTSIGYSAFAACANLKSASFPACTSIGGSAFSKCYKLSSLTLGASTVCTLANSAAFSSTPYAKYSKYFSGTPYIYVPASLVSTYKTATNWSYFSSYFSAI